MRLDFSYDYESLTLSERVNALAIARQEACDDVERGDFLNPYINPDPRFFAYREEFKKCAGIATAPERETGGGE